MHNKGKGKLLPMSRIAPKRNELSEIDTVASAKRYGDRRAFDILMEAQYYWNQMEDFRKDRERNKRYTYGFEWDDMIHNGLGCMIGSMIINLFMKNKIRD